MASVHCKTIHGVEMDIWDLDPRVVTVEHIASVLARINRYAGHWVNPISVARHCLSLVDTLKMQGCDSMVQLQGLFHDAAEAYTTDIPTPLKSRLLIELPATEDQLKSNFPSIRNSIAYSEFENGLLNQIYKRLSILWPIPQIVWDTDHAAYYSEIAIIRGEARAPYLSDPETTAMLFTRRAKSLMSECGISQ